MSDARREGFTVTCEVGTTGRKPLSVLVDPSKVLGRGMFATVYKCADAPRKNFVFAIKMEQNNKGQTVRNESK